MKLKYVRVASRPIATVCLIAGAGCASPHAKTPAERREALTELAIARPTISPTSLQKADAHGVSDYTSTIPRYTGGGLIPVLVGIALDEHYSKAQQDEFDKQFAAEIQAIRLSAPKLADEDVSPAIVDAVNRSHYLKSILSPHAKNELRAEVVRYGLVLKGEMLTADPRIAGQLVIDVKIVLEDGSILLSRKYSGMSDLTFSMRELAEQPMLVSALYRSALKSMAEFMGKQLALRYDGNSV